MSESKAETIVNFNKKSNRSIIRIPCGLHIIYITIITFDNTTFGKINSLSGLFLNFYPFNIINLAYHLYNEYNELNKNNSLNMKNEIISKLYKALLNINLNKYQKPITSCWLYQLIAAKQYLERRKIHLLFTCWFIKQLENSKCF